MIERSLDMSFSQSQRLQTFQLWQLANTILCCKPEEQVVFPGKAWLCMTDTKEAGFCEEPEPGLLFNILVQESESQKSFIYKKMNKTE